MRRISIGAASAAVALVLVACGSNDATVEPAGGPQPSSPLNGLETKSGPEVMQAAAEALRRIDSVHVTTVGQDPWFDLRLLRPDGTVGTVTDEGGVDSEILRLDGSTYMRYLDRLPPDAEGLVEPGQWVEAPSEIFEILSIDGIADEILSNVEGAKPEVQRVTEAGQPVLLVETTGGYKLWVSNVGTALPLRETDEHGLDLSFTEYDVPVYIEAPPAGEVVRLDPALTS